MKNITPSWLDSQGRKPAKRSSILLILSFMALTLLFASKADASHYRGGTLSWQKVSGQTNRVKFSMNMAWRTSWYFSGTPSIGATANVGSLLFGDGSSASIILKVTSVNTAEDWFYGTFSVEKTYTNATAFSVYRAYWRSNARISTLQNNRDTWMQLETNVMPGGDNSSPVSTLPPVVNLPKNLTAATFSVPYNDPDGDNVRFRLASAYEATGLTTGFSQPSNFSVNSSTGQVTYNTNNLTVGHLYNAVVVVEDLDANNNIKTKTMVEFIIKITNQSTPPAYDYSVTPPNGYIFQTSPGQKVSFGVKASDSDPNDNVTLNGIGLPNGVSFSTSLPTTNNPVSTTFSWTPTTSQLGSNVITFTAQDINGVTTNTSVTIVVSMKPLFDVPPTLANNSTRQYEPGMNVALKFQASDPDANDKVQIVAISGFPLPAGATLSANLPTTAANPTSTELSWTPSASNWGKHILKFRAVDTYNDQADHSVNVVVNSQPYFTSSAVTDATSGALYTYNIVATDPDLAYGDELEIITSNLPSWLTLTDNGDGTAKLSGTPSVADAGEYDISLVAEDIYHHGYPNTANNFQNFKLTVSACNIAISVSDFSDKICAGSSNGFIKTSVTGGTAPLTYSWTGTSATTADVSGLADGSYYVSVKDVNGCEAFAGPINISTNPLPEVTLADLDAVCEDAAAYGLTGGLPAGGTYSGTGVSNGKFNPATGTGTYEITYTYTNSNGCTNSAKKSITVNALPSTPGLALKDVNGNNIPNNTIFYGADGYDYANLVAASLGNGESGKWYDGTTEVTNTKVSPTASTKYTYVVTNTSGCVSTQDITVNVTDVRCGNKMDKVTICHKGKEICVAQSAVAAHLAHGCSLGDCTNGKLAVKKADGKNEAQNNEGNLANVEAQKVVELEEITENNFSQAVKMHKSLNLSASPNPFTTSTLITLFSSESNNISLGVYDIRGVLVNQLFNGNTDANTTKTVIFDGATLQSGIYFVRLVSGTEVQHIKLILTK